jgi:O-antigen/teichoic acid export membrane protein
LNKVRVLFLNNSFISKILESLLGRISYVAFTMLFSMLCTRLYGAEVFGKYTFAYTIIFFLMVVAKGGLDNGFLYYIPKYSSKHISFGFFINLILSLIIIIFGTLYINDIFILSMLPLIWFLSIEQLFFSIYRSENNIKEYYYINSFLSLGLRIILLVVFYFAIDNSEVSIILSLYISIIVSTLFFFYNNRKWFRRVYFDIGFIKYSFPLVLASLLGVMMDRIDLLMIGFMLTDKDTGIYQISVQVANIIPMILIVFNTVFAPKISRMYHENNIKQLKKLYINSTRILGVVSLLVSLLLIVTSQNVLLLFGDEILGGQEALILRVIGHLINVAVGSVWFMLAMTGSPRLQLYGNLIAFLINIFLNFMLIPRYGINGAAFASMLSMIFINVLGYYLVCKKFNLKVYKLL